MGVPAFFRWLSRKYPSIIVHCTEEKVRLPPPPPPGLGGARLRGSLLSPAGPRAMARLGSFSAPALEKTVHTAGMPGQGPGLRSLSGVAWTLEGPEALATPSFSADLAKARHPNTTSLWLCRLLCYY